MKIRNCFLFLILLISVPSFAVKIKEGAKGRKVASDSGLAVLLKIKQCSEEAQSVSGIRACSKTSLSTRLTPGEQDSLLMWFKYPYELSAPEVCDKELIKYIPDDKMVGVKVVLCSTYSVDGENRRVMFFFVEEEGLRLMNMKDNRISSH